MALNIPVNVSLPETGLTDQDVLVAVKALCDQHAINANQLVNAIQSLINQTDNWASQVGQINSDGLTVQYLKSNLSDVLSLSGEIALLKLSNTGFILLLGNAKNGTPLMLLGKQLP